MDFKGNLLAHAFIKKLSKFVCGILPPGACAGMFSKEILVLAAKIPDESLLESLVEQLAGFFNGLGVESFCQKNRLHVEIGAVLASKEGNACSTIQEALATSKKYV